MSGYPTSAQIRGARGMLDWSRTDLARAARLSISTIKRVEQLNPQAVSSDVYSTLRCALEDVGVTFLDDDGSGAGMRLGPPQRVTLRGRCSVP